MSKLVGIAIRYKKKAPMQILQTVDISKDFGLKGDFRGKPGKRQVTVLSQAAWTIACAELGVSLDWTTRRANLLVNNIDLRASTGKILVIGDAELLITKETDPCERMNDAWPGLFDSLVSEWRGGVCCRVLRDGVVELGDIVAFKD